MRVLLAGLLCAALAQGCAGSHAEGVRVYAAMSLRPPLVEARPILEAAAGAPIRFNFAASNHLASQILAAGEADLFLSADRIQMEIVEGAGYVAGGSPLIFLSNRLVVVVPAASSLEITGPEGLAGPEVARLSLADPDGVPAGRYARLWLERIGLWDRVADRVVPAMDVRAAVAAVESGGAQAGVVYRTDAALSPRVRITYEVPAPEGPVIEYVAALIAGSPARDRARALLEALQGPEVHAIFERLGFTTPAGSGS